MFVSPILVSLSFSGPVCSCFLPPLCCSYLCHGCPRSFMGLSVRPTVSSSFHCPSPNKVRSVLSICVWSFSHPVRHPDCPRFPHPIPKYLCAFTDLVVGHAEYSEPGLDFRVAFGKDDKLGHERTGDGFAVKFRRHSSRRVHVLTIHQPKSRGYLFMVEDI